MESSTSSSLNGDFNMNSSSWWHPPGVLDASVSDKMVSMKKSHRKTTPLIHFQMEEFIQAPTRTNLKKLYEIILQQQKTSCYYYKSIIGSSSSILTIKLLDVLAEQIVLHFGSTDHSFGQHEDTFGLYLKVFHWFLKDISIGYPSNSLGKCLVWLMTSITNACLHLSENTVNLLSLLQVFNTSLKFNPGIRLFIKNVKKIKEFYRSLTILLNSTEDSSFLILTMSILARLVLNEPLGSKLFSLKNLDQAFELIFSILLQETNVNNNVDPNEDVVVELQLSSIDLLCDLLTSQIITSRPDILTMFEQNKKVQVDNMVEFYLTTQKNELTEVGIHFLTSLCLLSTNCYRQKMLTSFVSSLDLLSKMLQMIVVVNSNMHRNIHMGILCIQFLLKLFSGHTTTINSTKETNEKISLLIGQMFDCVNKNAQILLTLPVNTTRTTKEEMDTNSGLLFMMEDREIKKEKEKEEEVDYKETQEYVYTYHLVELICVFMEMDSLRPFIMDKISLNSIAHLIQTESKNFTQWMNSSTHHQRHTKATTPKMSFFLIHLLTKVLTMEDKHKKLNEQTKRQLIQFLQSFDVALILGTIFFSFGGQQQQQAQEQDKELMVDNFMLIQQIMSLSVNKRYVAMELTEGLMNCCHFLQDQMDFFNTNTKSLHANVDSKNKMIEALQVELTQSVQLQEDIRIKQEEEMNVLKTRMLNEINQKEHFFVKQKQFYEAKIKEMRMEMDQLTSQMNKKMMFIQQKDLSIQEKNHVINVLKEEKEELTQKVCILETKMDQIGHLHAICQEENQLKEKENTSLQEDLTNVSKELTKEKTQNDLLTQQVDIFTQQNESIQEQNEKIYQELILLSKIHQELLTDKKHKEKEILSLQEEMSTLEQMNINCQTKLQKKIKNYENSQVENQNLQKQIQIFQFDLQQEKMITTNLENDKQNLQNQLTNVQHHLTAFKKMSVEKDEKLKENDQEILKQQQLINQLTNEIGKQAKLQALIHQLSSGQLPPPQQQEKQ